MRMQVSHFVQTQDLVNLHKFLRHPELKINSTPVTERLHTAQLPLVHAVSIAMNGGQSETSIAIVNALLDARADLLASDSRTGNSAMCVVVRELRAAGFVCFHIHFCSFSRFFGRFGVISDTRC